MKLIAGRQRTRKGEMPKTRHHKGLTFRPVGTFTTKRDLNRFLKHDFDGQKIAHNRYYRVYKHKYQGYIIYVSDKNKTTHGGVRRRSKTGEGRYSKKY